MSNPFEQNKIERADIPQGKKTEKNKLEEQPEGLTEGETAKFNEGFEDLKSLVEDEANQLAIEKDEKVAEGKPEESLEKRAKKKRFKQAMLVLSLGAAIMANSLIVPGKARAGESNFFNKAGRFAQKMSTATENIRKCRRATKGGFFEVGKFQELFGLKETDRQQRYREQAERYARDAERYARDAEREAQKVDNETQGIENANSERDTRRFENNKRRLTKNVERMADRAEKSADRAMDSARKANSKGGDIAANRAAMAAQQTRAIADRFIQ